MPLDRLFPFQGFDKLGNTLLGPSTAPSILLSGAAKRRALRAAATAGCQRTRGRGGIGSRLKLETYPLTKGALQRQHDGI